MKPVCATPGMNYTDKTREQLVALCKEQKITGISGKKKVDIIKMLTTQPTNTQDTGKFRTNTKDQFYTHPDVAKHCIANIHAAIQNASEYLWIEPSAGTGAFLHNIPGTYDKIGIDLDPRAPDIIATDFLTWSAPVTDKRIILFGNPPFGRQSSLAKSFIKKGCQIADVIAFILPKSFTKPSMTNTFATHFHCLVSTDLSQNAFLINGATSYDVPCVFQIWEKKSESRAIPQKIEPRGFTYVTGSSSFDIAVRRVGGLAGRCYARDGTLYSVQSHYFIRFATEETRQKRNDIMSKINEHEFPSNTTGPRSLSKSEVNIVLNDIILHN